MGFCGWQSQPQVPTVQQAVEQSLSTLMREQVGVVGCGRTDTGVHASDYYAHFDSDNVLPDQLVFKLNSMLPTGIEIYDIFEVPQSFHARFSATARTYRYRVSKRRQPFKQGIYSRIYYAPDLELLNRGAAILMEYEDFTSFAKLHTQVKTNICHLSEAFWVEEVDGWVFTITANRFLRNMVRSVVGTLLDVGRGALSLDGLRSIVEQKSRCAAGTSMPAQGLCLTHVAYPWHDIIGHDYTPFAYDM